MAPPAPAPTAAPAAVPAPIAVAPPVRLSERPTARGNAFGVHVSSFRRRATAEADAGRLGKELALPTRVLEVDLGAKGVWYRVVVGAFGSSAEALALRERLKEKGVPDGMVLKLGDEKRVR